jgi:membrane dipeptidase
MQQAVPIVDGHNDVLLQLELAARRGDHKSFVDGTSEGHIDLPRATAGGLAAGFFACYTPETLDAPLKPDEVVRTADGWEIPYAASVAHEHAVAVTLSLIARLISLEQASGGRVRIIRTADELDRCVAGEALGAILHLEGAEAVDPDLALLPVYHALGVRSVGLVWSRRNAFAEGVPFRFPASPDQGDGLRAAGRGLVEACNDLGIIVDLAHLNARGFWDVVELSRAPLVVSHSAVHALCPSSRNLLDDQLRAIADANGIVGLNLGTGDLRADGDLDDVDVPVSRVVEHIEYIGELVGIDHIGLGSDLDGAKMPKAIGDVSGLQTIVEALRARGLSERDVHKVANRNWTRVLRDTWTQQHTS